MIPLLLWFSTLTKQVVSSRNRVHTVSQWLKCQGNYHVSKNGIIKQLVLEKLMHEASMFGACPKPG